jgi:hypothetical protein
MKTLGQIANEAFREHGGITGLWADLARESFDRWEAVASAVATEAVERYKASLAEQEMEATVVSDAKRAAGHEDGWAGEVSEKMKEYGRHKELVERLLNPPMIVSFDSDGRTHIQKPEPSLLEVAAMIYAGVASEVDEGDEDRAISSVVTGAIKLIAAVREHEKAGAK